MIYEVTKLQNPTFHKIYKQFMLLKGQRVVALILGARGVVASN